jgi:hypothetical protein
VAATRPPAGRPLDPGAGQDRRRRRPHLCHLVRAPRRRLPGPRRQSPPDPRLAPDRLLRPGHAQAGRVERLRRAPRPAGGPRPAPLGRPFHARGQERPGEGGAVRCLPQRPGSRPGRLHGADGRRDQRANAGRGPSPPGLPLASRRHPAAGGAHPASGEPERGGEDPPLRHRGLIRRLRLGHRGAQGHVHRPGHARPPRRARDRGHRRRGAHLPGGQGPGHGQPAAPRPGPGPGRRRAAGAPGACPRSRPIRPPGFDPQPPGRDPAHGRAARLHPDSDRAPAGHARRRLQHDRGRAGPGQAAGRRGPAAHGPAPAAQGPEPARRSTGRGGQPGWLHGHGHAPAGHDRPARGAAAAGRRARVGRLAGREADRRGHHRHPPGEQADRPRPAA